MGKRDMIKDIITKMHYIDIICMIPNTTPCYSEQVTPNLFRVGLLNYNGWEKDVKFTGTTPGEAFKKTLWFLYNEGKVEELSILWYR